jgi:hypothetical protein
MPEADRARSSHSQGYRFLRIGLCAWLRFEAAVRIGGAVRVQCAVNSNVMRIGHAVEGWTVVEVEHQRKLCSSESVDKLVTEVVAS